ncbi:MAG: hypothetical protein ISS45_06170 [Candidatus Omnitrophica bacterium]|nr:hypothetical protein [Candidatus Omnitrophota bacterium]
MDIKKLYLIRTLAIFSFIFSLTILGCASSGPLLKPDIDSRQGYVMNHPELSYEIKQAILEGRVIEGMTKDDVRASWGEPDEIFDFSKDRNAWWYEEDREGWIYRAFPLSLEPTRSVTFKNSKVVNVSESYK